MLSGTEPPFTEVQMSLFLMLNTVVGRSIMFPLKIIVLNCGSSRISLSMGGCDLVGEGDLS